jgi:hypothetical protein
MWTDDDSCRDGAEPARILPCQPGFGISRRFDAWYCNKARPESPRGIARIVGRLAPQPHSLMKGAQLSYKGRLLRVAHITKTNLETDFVLRCCSVGRDPEWLDDNKRLVGLDPDWRRVEQAARRHEVSPLVARHLMSLSSPSSVDPAFRNLRISFQANALRNLHLSRELTNVLAAFHDVGIPVMPFKGPVLSELVYGDPALRMFSDLDILIPEHSVPRSAEVLESLGYRPETFNLDAFRSGFFHASEVAFVRRDHGISVDVHWRLSPGYYDFGPDGQDVWERSIAATFNGIEIQTLAHEDLLLYLCVHASRHGWPTLRHVCDVAQTVHRATDLDWECVTRRAVETKSLRMLRIGLTLAHALLGAAIPSSMIRAAESDKKDAKVTTWIAQRLLAAESSWSHEFIAPLRAIRRSSDKARYCIIHTVKPTLLDWQFWPLNRELYPIYYVLRPMRIIVEMFRRIGKVARY